MELSTDQQIFELIKKSGRILILLPGNLTVDALAGGLAFKIFLAKLHKEAEVVSASPLPENLKFLPGADGVKHLIPAGKSLVVSLDTSIKKLAEISYHKLEGKVSIFLKPEGETEFLPQDISFNQEKFPADLVIILDGKSLDSLGKLYDQHTDLLFETPKINIDNKADNEYFGAVNLVDVTATSVSEILADLFAKYEHQLIDEDMATCLLAGIIQKTASFQHVQTTPKSFLKASELVALGARQQEIVKNIYKTKSLNLLKLWGRALARMKLLEPAKVIYSVLGFADFERAESGETEILPVLHEFLDNISGYKIVGLLTEAVKGKAAVSVAVHEQLKPEDLLAALGGNGKLLDFHFGNYRIIQTEAQDLPLEALENHFLDALKTISAS